MLLCALIAKFCGEDELDDSLAPYAGLDYPGPTAANEEMPPPLKVVK
jgi:hypothetical protein